jgi:hydroxyacylglutathione hydrolase
MQIKQWEDKYLAHFSYGILSDCERKIVLIDPSRNPGFYLDYAKDHDATIIGIIETHPHADFVSSHLELHQRTGATIYVSKWVGVSYPHKAFDEGDSIEFGKIKLTALHTPGHSPDSITIVLEHEGKQKAAFTGDTLFIGDCGRPDLREGAGNLQVARTELAKQMYHSLRDKLMSLEDDTIVYPAHGAGSLCGKGLSKANSSTIGEEKRTNWCLQLMTEEVFAERLLSDQPFIPAYFPFDVELNRKGASPFSDSVATITTGADIKNEEDALRLDKNIVIIDARKGKDFKQGHLPNAYNIIEGAKFETWLGSIIKPGEPFYLAAENKEQLQQLLERTASIGYEQQVKEAFVLTYAPVQEELLDVTTFREHTGDYTIVDIRNTSEVKQGKPFSNSITIPLADLRSRVEELPTDKPIVVHCAGGSRSSAGSSIIRSSLNGKVKVYDLGEAVKEFSK